MGNQNWQGSYGNFPTTMPLIKGGGTTTMGGRKKSVTPIDHHLMVIKLNKANNINLFSSRLYF